MDWESTYRASPVVTSLYLLPEAFHVHKDTTTLEAPSRAGDSALDVFGQCTQETRAQVLTG
jgi:hypothetical protein